MRDDEGQGEGFPWALQSEHGGDAGDMMTLVLSDEACAAMASLQGDHTRHGLSPDWLESLLSRSVIRLHVVLSCLPGADQPVRMAQRIDAHMSELMRIASDELTCDCPTCRAERRGEDE